MFRKYSILPVLSLLVAGLAWWAQHFEPQGCGSVPRQVKERRAKAQKELLETLDLLVTHEHYYRSINGRFTKISSRLGFAPPKELAHRYEVQIVEASTDRLLITAFSEIDGRIEDLASIDQDYKVRANFPVFRTLEESLRLRNQALKELSKITHPPLEPSEADGRKVNSEGNKKPLEIEWIPTSEFDRDL